MNTDRSRKIRGISYKNEPYRKLRWCYERVVNGKRIRTFFATETAAIRAKQQADAESKQGADSRLLFDAKAQKEYVTAKRILAGKISLVDCALWFRENASLWNARDATVPEAVNAALDSIATRDLSKTRKRLSALYLRKFSQAFHDRKLASVRGKEVAEWVISQSPNSWTQKTAKGIVVAFFNRMVALEYIQTAPKIPSGLLAKDALTPIAVYSVETIRRLMNHLLATHDKHLPTVALLAFCGLRRNEANLMRWEWIDEARKRIVIPAKICKTRDDWVLQSPTLPETAWKWLSAVPANKKNGRVPPLGNGTARKLFSRIGAKKEKNGFRHTFCTMHISLADSAEKTALLLRHRGTQMLYRHYLAKLVPKEEAEAYFAISPEPPVSPQPPDRSL